MRLIACLSFLFLQLVFCSLVVAQDTNTVAIAQQPQNLTVVEGDEASFAVEASGAGELTFQWLADGQILVDETASTLSLGAVTLADSGVTYTVVVTDENGSITSDGAALSVQEPVVTVAITQQPQNLTVVEGDEASFAVEASGAGELTFQWLADGQILVDETASTLSLGAVALIDSGVTYTVVVTDENGSITSDGAVLSVQELVVTVAITQQPQNLTVVDGDEASFAVEASGAGELTFQWLADGQILVDETASTLSLGAVALIDSGVTYTVVVTDENGSITSDGAVLSVQELVVTVAITQQPQNQTVVDGDEASFAVGASGAGELTFQWLADGQILVDETASTLSLGAVALIDSGVTYTVVVTDENGSVTSDGAVLSVQEPVVTVAITQQPQNLTVVDGDEASFAVGASGVGELMFQWLADGQILVDETASTLSLGAVALTDSGVTYAVVVTDENGSVTSDGAVLSVQEPVVTVAITQQPQNLTVVEGDEASFAVGASGAGELMFQWLADGQILVDETASTLSLGAVALTDSGVTYTVVVTDENGSVTSDGAVLSVQEPVVTVAITQQPQNLTVVEGDEASFAVGASGAGELTFQWLADGQILVDETASTLSLGAVALTDSGVTYTVVVTDENGSVTSDGAVLSVIEDIPLEVISPPADLTVTESEDASFSVVAVGGGTLTYQWFANGELIDGATNSTLILSTVALSDSGTVFRVQIKDGIQTSVFATAMLTVVGQTPLVISAQPSDLVVTEGEEAQFSVEATGSGSLSYQWFANGAAIAGETSDVLTIIGSTLDDDGTEYNVEVSNGLETVTSDVVILGVLPEDVDIPVTVVSIGQGELASDKVGAPRWVRLDFDSLGTATHTISVSWDSDADVRYRVFMGGGTAISSTVRGANPGVWVGELDADMSYYIGLWASEGNANYSVTLAAAVEESLVISTQPSDLVVSEGEEAQFTVEATGSGSLSYQWFANGAAIAGETSNVLTIIGSTLDDDGTEYNVEVSNGLETVTSDFAILGVLPEDVDIPVTVVSIGQGELASDKVGAPRWVRLDFDSLGTATHTISVSWDSDADMRYRVFMEGGTAISSTVRGANPGVWVGELDADISYYIGLWASEGNANYSVTLAAAVEESLVISTQPSDLIVTEGEEAQFTVEATGSGSLSYQWFANGAVIAGETSNVLTIIGSTLDDDGTEYNVEVSNGLETVTSDTVLLEVITGTDDPDLTSSLVLNQVLDYGTADSEKMLGARHSVVSFTPQQTGSVTLELSWEGDSKMNLAVFDSETDQRLEVDNTAGLSPKSITLDLESGLQYRATLWIDEGTAEWVLRRIQTVADPDYAISDVPDSADRPNIVLINTDDQRASTLDFLPAIQEHLVNKGITFENTIVPTPSCCPSRATTLSGRYVHNNGQFQQQLQNEQIFENTIQKYLKADGYFTGHAGKYLHWVRKTDPVPPYWDRWTYITGGFYDVDMNFDDLYIKPGGYTTDIVFERTKDYLREFESLDDDNPWFVYIAPTSPHSPYTAEYEFKDAEVPELQLNSLASLEADISDKPDFLRFRYMDFAEASDIHNQRARNLLSLDREVDQLMDYLEASGELDNTLIIFTSDNGYLLGEHQTYGKFTPYRDSVQVPLVIRWPGNVQENELSDSFVSHVDIAPTILDAAGVDTTEILLDGRNIFDESRDLFFMEYFRDRASNSGRIGDWASLRTDSYQYTEWYSDGTNDVVFREYYDMLNDPYQLENLLMNDDPDDDPDVTILSPQLQDARTCVGSECP